MENENENGSDGAYENYMDAEDGDELDAEHEDDYNVEHYGASENIEQVMLPLVPVVIIPNTLTLYQEH